MQHCIWEPREIGGIVTVLTHLELCADRHAQKNFKTFHMLLTPNILLCTDCLIFSTHLMYLVLPYVLLQLLCSPQLGTVRQEGCQDGCFWTTLPSGTCAKAVCSHLSQHQHGVGCQGKPCGCDFPSQILKFFNS